KNSPASPGRRVGWTGTSAGNEFERRLRIWNKAFLTVDDPAARFLPVVMRVVVLFFAFLLAGCAVSKPDLTASAAQTKRARSSKPAAVGRGQKIGSRQEVTLDEAVLGPVVSVNPALRFLVTAFPGRRLPVLEQRLNVYRNGQQ